MWVLSVIAIFCNIATKDGETYVRRNWEEKIFGRMDNRSILWKSSPSPYHQKIVTSLQQWIGLHCQLPQRRDGPAVAAAGTIAVVLYYSKKAGCEIIPDVNL
jgi:hypothetical protein